MNEILRNHSIFEISNMVFFTIIVFIVLVLIFKEFRTNKIFKAHKILILVAIAVGMYALVWLTFFKNILTLKDIDLLFLFLYGSPIILFLAFTGIPAEIDMHYGNDKSRSSNDIISHDRDYNSTTSFRDELKKYHRKENEKEREEHYYSENNTSYSSDDFDFDDD